MENLINDINQVSKDKKLVVFDLDGTLTESKADMDAEMAELLEGLFEKRLVAVIGGQEFQRFQEQFISKLRTPPEALKNLFLFPTTATTFYKHDGSDWKEIYREELSQEEKKKVMEAFEKTFQKLNYQHPEKIYGELIEDRGTQITFSALGNQAPLEVKEKWNRENLDLRSKMEAVLQGYLPNMEAKVAGLTSIDVTRKGVDKGYGIRQISRYLNVPISEMLFVGDAFFPEGNDEPVLKTGVLCFEVKGVGGTRELIKYLLD